MPELKKGFVLLFNANHAMMKVTFDELGMGAAQLLIGESPTPSVLRAAPWVMRGLLLIPMLQFASLLLSLKLVSQWRGQGAAQGLNRGRIWRRYGLLPFIVNFLTTFSLFPLLSQMRGFIKLFMPDFTWIALVCGSFGGIWTFLHAILFLQFHQKKRSKKR